MTRPTCWRKLVSTFNAPMQYKRPVNETTPLVRADLCPCGEGEGLALDFDNGERICYSCGRPATGGPPRVIYPRPDNG